MRRKSSQAEIERIERIERIDPRVIAPYTVYFRRDNDTLMRVIYGKSAGKIFGIKISEPEIAVEEYIVRRHNDSLEWARKAREAGLMCGAKSAKDLKAKIEARREMLERYNIETCVKYTHHGLLREIRNFAKEYSRNRDSVDDAVQEVAEEDPGPAELEFAIAY